MDTGHSADYLSCFRSQKKILKVEHTVMSLYWKPTTFSTLTFLNFRVPWGPMGHVPEKPQYAPERDPCPAPNWDPGYPPGFPHGKHIVQTFAFVAKILVFFQNGLSLFATFRFGVDSLYFFIEYLKLLVLCKARPSRKKGGRGDHGLPFWFGLDFHRMNCLLPVVAILIVIMVEITNLISLSLLFFIIIVVLHHRVGLSELILRELWSWVSCYFDYYAYDWLYYDV